MIGLDDVLVEQRTHFRDDECRFARTGGFGFSRDQVYAVLVKVHRGDGQTPILRLFGLRGQVILGIAHRLVDFFVARQRVQTSVRSALSQDLGSLSEISGLLLLLRAWLL